MLSEIDGQTDRATMIYRRLLADPSLPVDIRASVEARLTALTGE